MATVDDLKGWLNDPASGGMVYGRNWSGLCQAFVWQACNQFGSAPVSYGSAYEAYQNSAIVSTDSNAAPAGSFHYWAIAMPDGHVAIGLGNGQVAMGSSKVTDMWATNAGSISVDDYTAKVGGHYLGWANSNGANTISLEPVSSNSTGGGVSGYAYGLTTGAQLAAQSALTTLGYYSGPCDGEFGPNSVAAFQAFLRDRGFLPSDYTVDGEPGVNYGTAVQALAQGYGYTGPLDGEPGDNTSNAIVAWGNSIAAPAPAPVPAPEPAPVVEPAPAPTVVDPIPVPAIEPAAPEATVTPEPVTPTETPAPTPEPENTVTDTTTTPADVTVEPEVDPAEQAALIATLPEQNLGAIIPSAKGRKIAYAVYAGASLAVTNVAVGFAALASPFPAWLTVAIAVIGNLATPFSAIAIANAKDPSNG